MAAGSGSAILSSGFELRLDDTEVGGITYIGESAPDSITSAATWRIKQLTETGPDLVIEWADGDTNFDNIWDDRASLSYS